MRFQRRCTSSCGSRPGSTTRDDAAEARNIDLALPDRAAKPLFGPAPLKAILHAVDLDVDEGEWVGVVGESGSGKSTLARTLLRLHRPDTGTIRFAGNDITALPE
ncbi:MAG TPA: ATP-binding cassette domain-containing protein, partial [Burkholderiaceae bacterium]|nr:ATP-binding cassette domain-containing protein [Burkholderiaceae bacterium]